LESFLVPTLWAVEDQEYILSRGIACIQRAGVDGVKLVADNPTLNKYKDNIWIIPQRISNTISSTEVRTNIKMNQTVKYLTPDGVIKYIYDNQLYGSTPRRMSTVIGFSPPTALALTNSSSMTSSPPASPSMHTEPLTISINSPSTSSNGGAPTGGSLPSSPGTGVTPGTRLRSSLPVPASFPLSKIRRIKKLSSSGLPLAVLVSCGTFSPVVNQNLAMFEAARNYLSFETKRFEVVGGILSAVHDSYARSGADALLPSNHRIEMVISSPLLALSPLPSIICYCYIVTIGDSDIRLAQFHHLGNGSTIMDTNSIRTIYISTLL
jgi:nicotinic acid mononucleotide adenylyltransferase